MNAIERRGDEAFMAQSNVHWIYWARLYNTRFQAGCVAKRMEEDWWIYGLDCPREVEIIQTRRGRYGVRYVL